ncbi:MAG TPA: ABC-2 family transporter protein [Vitreimonas sp.]|nr:ABC-2 family transporter protein [Vitreimonas sp.]
MLVKYWEIAKRSFIKSLTYRSEISLWLVLDAVPVIILMVVWSSIYATHTTVKGLTLDQVLQYYFIGLVINSLCGVHFESWRVQQIREGKIDFFLIKPLGFVKEMFLHDVGGKSLYFLMWLPFYLLLVMAITTIFEFSIPALSVNQALVFIGLLFYAYLTEFMIGTLIVLLGFWFEGAEGLEHFKWIVITLFSGSMIPIAFMPNWLAMLTRALPLKYMYAVPISIVQSSAVLEWGDLVVMAGFLFGLMGLIAIIWKFAVRHYASSGG